MTIAAATRFIPGTSVQRFPISGLELTITAAMEHISGISVQRFPISGPDLRINAETTVSGEQFTYCDNDLPQAEPFFFETTKI